MISPAQNFLKNLSDDLIFDISEKLPLSGRAAFCQTDKQNRALLQPRLTTLQNFTLRTDNIFFKSASEQLAEVSKILIDLIHDPNLSNKSRFHFVNHLINNYYRLLPSIWHDVAQNITHSVEKNAKKLNSPQAENNANFLLKKLKNKIENFFNEKDLSKELSLVDDFFEESFLNALKENKKFKEKSLAHEKTYLNITSASWEIAKLFTGIGTIKFNVISKLSIQDQLNHLNHFRILVNTIKEKQIFYKSSKTIDLIKSLDFIFSDITLITESDLNKRKFIFDHLKEKFREVCQEFCQYKKFLCGTELAPLKKLNAVFIQDLKDLPPDVVLLPPSFLAKFNYLWTRVIEVDNLRFHDALDLLDELFCATIHYLSETQVHATLMDVFETTKLSSHRAGIVLILGRFVPSLALTDVKVTVQLLASAITILPKEFDKIRRLIALTSILLLPICQERFGKSAIIEMCRALKEQVMASITNPVHKNYAEAQFHSEVPLYQAYLNPN